MLSRDPGTITRQEIVAVLDKVRDGVPGHAAPRPGSVANLRARIHGLLAWAENTGRVASNVMSGYRSKRRSRAERLEALEALSGGVMLDMAEIAALWRACEDPRVNQSFGAYVKLLILTGCRRGEMAQARLSWITPARGEKPAFMNIPATTHKERQAARRPVAAARGGRRRERWTVHGPRSSRDAGRAVQKHRQDRRDQRTGAKSWPRVLQRSPRTTASRASARRTICAEVSDRIGRGSRVRDAVAEAALNHAPKDTLIAIYNKHDFLDERIEAAARWSEEIAAALGRAPPVSAEVVALRPAARTPKRRSLRRHRLRRSDRRRQETPWARTSGRGL